MRFFLPRSFYPSVLLSRVSSAISTKPEEAAERRVLLAKNGISPPPLGPPPPPLLRSFASTSDDMKLSAYEVLESHNFSIRLLPKGCVGYDLDIDSGEFLAYFNRTCSFSLEGSYQLRYQPTISGDNQLIQIRLRQLRTR